MTSDPFTDIRAELLRVWGVPIETARKFRHSNVVLTHLDELEKELERLRTYDEARTEAEDGDSIWRFYDEKVWWSLRMWKEKYEAAEKEIARLKETYRKRVQQ